MKHRPHLVFGAQRAGDLFGNEQHGQYVVEDEEVANFDKESLYEIKMS